MPTFVNTNSISQALNPMPFPLVIYEDLKENITPVNMALIDDIACSGEDFLYPALKE